MVNSHTLYMTSNNLVAFTLISDIGCASDVMSSCEHVV